MASSDDEQAIMEAEALKQWLREQPEQSDNPVHSAREAEERSARETEALRQWAAKKPTSNRKRGDDR